MQWCVLCSAVCALCAVCSAVVCIVQRCSGQGLAGPVSSFHCRGWPGHPSSCPLHSTLHYLPLSPMSLLYTTPSLKLPSRCPSHPTLYAILPLSPMPALSTFTQTISYLLFHSAPFQLSFSLGLFFKLATFFIPARCASNQF